MKKFLILLSLVFFNGVLSQVCNFDTCSDCAAAAGCGWCGPTQQCLAGNKQGPSGGSKCYGTSWFFGAASCPNCTAITDCRECLYWSQDCAWCATGRCQEWGASLGCSPQDTCPCGVWPSCSTCNKDPGCMWCGSNHTCVTYGDASCPMPAHSCPCSENADCKSCREDATGACVWCDSQSGAVCTRAAHCTGAPVLNCNAFCSTNGQTCTTCNALPGCGWCSNPQGCVDVSTSACSAPLQHACPQCGSHRFCDTCTEDGCIWCENGECRNRNSDMTGCLVTHTCDSYCSYFGACTDCNNAPGCGWCENSGCVDVDKASCLFVHSCNSNTPSCSFDGGAFVGGMFLGIGLCAIGVGGYLFYRWKIGKKPGYSELH